MFVKKSKPKISLIYKGIEGRILNFQLFENPLLKVNLHLKLKSFNDESFSLTTVFSIWIAETKRFGEIDRNKLNLEYGNLTLVNEIVNFLKARGYFQFPLFDVNEYNSQQYDSGQIEKTWLLRRPRNFLSLVKETLNVNPIKLFREVWRDLQALEVTINSFENLLPNSPDEWYEKLNMELKLFLNKGKELFLKVSEILDAGNIYEEDLKGTKEVKKGKSKDFSLDDFYALFKTAAEEDEEITSKEKGFRSYN
ncbi:unnamed protein product, partial [marine sediment metagenome]